MTSWPWSSVGSSTAATPNARLPLLSPTTSRGPLERGFLSLTSFYVCIVSQEYHNGCAGFLFAIHPDAPLLRCCCFKAPAAPWPLISALPSRWLTDNHQNLILKKDEIDLVQICS